MPDDDSGLRFGGLHLICDDIDATLAFYRLLGVAVPDEAVWRGRGGVAHHVHGARIGEGALEMASPVLAAEFHAGYRTAPAPGAAVIGFDVATRSAVDDLHDRLVAAGHPSRQAPYDAFWGARYAIVADPDGRDVGLMSPQDDARLGTPPDL